MVKPFSEWLRDLTHTVQKQEAQTTTTCPRCNRGTLYIMPPGQVHKTAQPCPDCNGTGKIKAALQSTDPLPEGVWEGSDGELYIACYICGEPFEVPCDLDELGPPDTHYCGSGPRCCP